MKWSGRNSNLAALGWAPLISIVRAHRMASGNEQLRKIERQDRLNAFGSWTLGLGLSAFLVAISAIGLIGISNPKIATSFFSAIAGEGFLRWAVLPLMAVSAVLVVAGGVVKGIAYWRHDEL